MFYLVSRPFAFGGIRHPDLTPFLRWIPVIIAAALAFLFYILPIRPKLSGGNSLSSDLINIFAILPGFFIAAIAAVATFDRAEMDEVMPEPAPEMKLRTGQDESYVKLTFRMFISHLFAYLTTLSFIAVFIVLSADLLAPSARFIVNGLFWPRHHGIILTVLDVIYVCIVSWLAAKIFLTTMVGLYFLAERIHRPDS